MKGDSLSGYVIPESGEDVLSPVKRVRYRVRMFPNRANRSRVGEDVPIGKCAPSGEACPVRRRGSESVKRSAVGEWFQIG